LRKWKVGDRPSLRTGDGAVRGGSKKRVEKKALKDKDTKFGEKRERIEPTQSTRK